MSKVKNGGLIPEQPLAVPHPPPITFHTEPLPDARVRKVEEGLWAMQQIVGEREELRTQLDEARMRCRGTQSELEALNLAYQRLLTEIEDYRRERDYAVAKRAEVEAVFGAAIDLMQKYRGRPLVQETAPAADLDEEIIVGASG